MKKKNGKKRKKYSEHILVLQIYLEVKIHSFPIYLFVRIVNIYFYDQRYYFILNIKIPFLI